MGLRKDPESGNFVLTAAKAVRKNRSNRRKYNKRNLGARSQGFFGWLAGLFKADPFKSSPIASYIGKQTKFADGCRAMQTSGIPLDASHYLMLQVHGGLNDHLVDAQTEADGYLDELDNTLNQEEAFLDHCRPEIIKADLKSELDKEIDSLDSAFGPLARNAAEERVHLEYFRTRHQLPNAFHWGERFTTGNILLLLGIVVFEFLLNSTFFAGSNPLGLVGGASLALLMSIVTVSLGIFLGIAYQLNHKTAEGGGWIGKIMFAVVSLIALFYLLLLTLAREAGEAGEIQMFRAAAKEILERPFSGLLDLPSFAYFIFSIAVIIYAAVKWVTIMGRFYGLRRRVLHAEDAELAYDDEINGAGDHFRMMAEGQLEALDSLPMFIQETQLSIKDIEMDYENVVEQHENDCGVVANASKLLYSYARSHTSGGTVEVNAFADRECAASVKKYADRLAELRARVRKLADRDDVKSSTVDKCRDDMRANLQAALETLKVRTAEIKQARLQEKREQMSDNPANAY